MFYSKKSFKYLKFQKKFNDKKIFHKTFLFIYKLIKFLARKS